nr:S1 RNA-binding domain-containing protein [Streptomyces sp. 846.5]
MLDHGVLEASVDPAITELSEEVVCHPEDALRVGDELTVRILTIDRQRRRVSLSLKPHPTATTDS